MRSIVSLCPAFAVPLAISLAAAPAAADDVGFVRGGPKDAAAKSAAAAAIGDARRDMAPCWRRGGAAVQVAMSVDADGAVTSAAARTDGAAAQCVAGILAVSPMPRGAAWTGIVSVPPGGGGGGGAGGSSGVGSDDVSASLGKHAAELRACQKADPKAVGVVEIDLRVKADGSITDVAVAHSLSAALDGCLTKFLTRLRLDDYRGKEVRYRLGLQYAGGDVTSSRNLPPPPEGNEPGAPPAPTKRGPLEVDALASVIEHGRARIDHCGAGLASGGTMIVRFTVRKDGSVKNLGVKQSVGDAKVEACVLDVVGGLKFPSAGDETQVQFPLVFAK